jgi:hypothetical protein
MPKMDFRLGAVAFAIVVLRSRARGARPPPPPPPSNSKRAAWCILCSQCLLQQPTYVQDRQFRGLAQLNSADGLRVSRMHHRLALDESVRGVPFASASRWFPSEKLEDRLARCLAAHRCIDMKEWTESFEFFTRCRKAMVVRRRGSRKEEEVSSSSSSSGGGGGFELADLCCGHGLTAILWAVFERRVSRCILVDEKRPASHDAIMRAACEVAPWARQKVVYWERTLQSAAPALPVGCSVIAVHACGAATDACLDVVVSRTRGRFAVMPCCYGKPTAPNLPAAVHAALGRGLAQDTARTFRMHQEGYEIEWSAIPAAITNKNRIIMGRPKGSTTASR